MTKKDFFRIAFKLLGLYFMIQSVFYYIPSNVIHMFRDFSIDVLLMTLGATLLTIVILILLISKTDKIIEFLKLDKGFDDDRIEFKNIDTHSLAKFAIILIGGLLIVDHIIYFANYTYSGIKAQVYTQGIGELDEFNFPSSVDYGEWIITGLNVFLGFLLLMNYDKVSKWLMRKEFE